MKQISLLTLFGIFTLTIILTFSPQLMPTSNVFATSSNDTSGQNASSNDQSMTTEDEMSTDGTTRVEINTSPAVPTSGQPLLIALSFTDANGTKIHHQNYAITVMQGSAVVFDNQHGHTHTGNDIQTTDALPSSSPVDIKVTLNGIGLPNTDPSTWTGPKGDVISFNVVPEFGSIAPIVLAIAVISIVAFTAKNRVPKL